VFLSLLTAWPVTARVLDRVVALVDGRLLSASQLDFEARVMLIDRGGIDAATAALDAPALQNHDADRAQVAEVLARALRTEKFIEGRVRLRSQVPESDVRKAWEADPGGKSWEEARGPLRDRLQRERAFVLARDALVQLRTAVPVRIVTPPEELVREGLTAGARP